jgi:DNA topoisomerase-6 subunit B
VSERQPGLPFEASASGSRGSKGSGKKRPSSGGSRGTKARKKPPTRRRSSGGKRSASAPAAKRASLKKNREAAGRDRSAEAMAGRQRDISVSEFFAKNRHLLGFDNPAKALLTTVKELVDNALDAADEARIPADVTLQIDQLAEDRFRVSCTDNGPGIVPQNVPMVFGKLLFGSKFHRLKMSRGQQGIGVSAAGMYGLLTTGHAVRVVSRTAAHRPALRFEIQIDTQKNQPTVRQKEEVDWDSPHGTSVEIELEASYRKGQHSVDSYLRQISLANPHATIRYLAPDRDKPDTSSVYERVTDELPPETDEIKPHPYGVELGVLMQMLRESKSRNLSGFLVSEFSRVSTRTAAEICQNAKLDTTRRPQAMGRGEAEALHKAIANTKIMAPPTDCIAPIGEELLESALHSIHPGEMICAVTRRPTVYRGNPFLIEVALSYGVDTSGDEPITVYRYANRVPLQYQQGACAITRAVTAVDWKKYGLAQPRGGLPVGSMVLLVHIASVWVPFTSESKEAVAQYPEIVKEIRLALQDCGRKLGTFINRRRREADEAKKRSYIEKYIPQLAVALQQILDHSDSERDATVSKLTDVLERSRKP